MFSRPFRSNLNLSDQPFVRKASPRMAAIVSIFKEDRGISHAYTIHTYLASQQTLPLPPTPPESEAAF